MTRARRRNQHVQSPRPNPQMGVQGGIIDGEAPLHVSNVLIFNPATQKGDRVGFSARGAARSACSVEQRNGRRQVRNQHTARLAPIHSSRSLSERYRTGCLHPR